MTLDSSIWFLQSKVQCDCCDAPDLYKGPDGCVSVELQIVSDNTLVRQDSWSLEDNVASLSVGNSALAGLDYSSEPIRVISTCISPTSCFELTTDFEADVKYEVFTNNTSIYYGPNSSIYFGYSSEMGNITLSRRSFVQELCRIDHDMGHNQSLSTLRSKLDHVLGMSGSKYVVF
jgi:hypothetical protein